MLRDRLHRSLRHLGIPPRDAGVLKLLPLVHVAWADGKMDPLRRERIHNYAETECGLGPAGSVVLDRWLTDRPTHEYVLEGLEDMYLLARAGDSSDVDVTELPAILSYAEGIARSTMKALDEPDAVSPAEDEALDEIAHVLHVDHGESWARLLNELR